MRIEEIVSDQLTKTYSVWNGGYLYGRDYNRVKVIMFHHGDKVLVKDIVETIEDETLKSKVKSWMKKKNRMKDIKKRYSGIFARIAYQGKSSNIREGAIRAFMASIRTEAKNAV